MIDVRDNTCEINLTDIIEK